LKFKIRDRIKELRRVPASELVANPKNWRRHPKHQQNAMMAALKEVGYADALLAREDKKGRLILIDGHLRASISPKEQVPVLILDVSEAEADKILASADPIAGMAETDFESFKSLTGAMEFKVPDFGKMIAGLAMEDSLSIPDAPESVKRNVADLASIKAQRAKGKEGIIGKSDTEKYLVIVFPSRQAKERKLQSLKLPIDERYLSAEAIDLSVISRSTQIPSNGRSTKAARPNHSGAQG